MAFELRILGDFNIIELRLEGVVNFEEFVETRRRVHDIYEQHGPLKTLIDMREMEFGMSTSSIYEFASTVKHPIGANIALVSRPKDVDTRFFETVALNKGVQIKLFTDYSEALAYLTG